MAEVFVFVGIFVVIAVVIYTVQLRMQQERTMQLRAVAQGLEFSFLEEAAPHGGLGRFHLFSQGHSRKARNVMQGRVNGVEVAVFDYQYKTSSGKSQSTRTQTVVLFESERLRLPFFTLRPEHALHRLAGMMGYQDIDFDTYPQFSDRYLLQGDDERAIRAAFDERVLAFFARRSNLSAEGMGRSLIYYMANHRVEPGQVKGWLQQGLDVLDLFVEPEAEPEAEPKVEAVIPDQPEPEAERDVVAELDLPEPEAKEDDELEALLDLVDLELENK